MEFDVRVKTAIYGWIAETTRAPLADDMDPQSDEFG